MFLQYKQLEKINRVIIIHYNFEHLILTTANLSTIN